MCPADRPCFTRNTNQPPVVKPLALIGNASAYNAANKESIGWGRGIFEKGFEGSHGARGARRLWEMNAVFHVPESEIRRRGRLGIGRGSLQVLLSFREPSHPQEKNGPSRHRT